MDREEIKRTLQDAFQCFISKENCQEIIKLLDDVKTHLEENLVFEELHEVQFPALLLSDALGKLLDWEDWKNRIPYINFDPDMCVSIVPPFYGAMVRFFVTRKGSTPERGKISRVSVYLDCHKVLGIMSGGPYWEVFPVDNDVSRVPVDDIDELLEQIRLGLDSIEKKNNHG